MQQIANQVKKQANLVIPRLDLSKTRDSNNPSPTPNEHCSTPEDSTLTPSASQIGSSISKGKSDNNSSQMIANMSAMREDKEEPSQLSKKTNIQKQEISQGV